VQEVLLFQLNQADQVVAAKMLYPQDQQERQEHLAKVMLVELVLAAEAEEVEQVLLVAMELQVAKVVTAETEQLHLFQEHQ